MVQRAPRLDLPLVDHLVQHRVLDRGPPVAGQVAAADGDLEDVTAYRIRTHLAEPSLHLRRQPERYLTEEPAEPGRIEPPVEIRQPLQHQMVSGTASLSAPRAGSIGRHMEMDGEARKEPPGAGARSPGPRSRGDPGDNGVQHVIRRVGESTVKTKPAGRVKAKEDLAVGVGAHREVRREAAVPETPDQRVRFRDRIVAGRFGRLGRSRRGEIEFTLGIGHGGKISGRSEEESRTVDATDRASFPRKRESRIG